MVALMDPIRRRLAFCLTVKDPTLSFFLHPLLLYLVCFLIQFVILLIKLQSLCVFIKFIVVFTVFLDFICCFGLIVVKLIMILTSYLIVKLIIEYYFLKKCILLISPF